MKNRKPLSIILLLGFFMALNCCGTKTDSKVLTAEMPLHLEDHIGQATIIGSEVSEKAVSSLDWQFDKPQTDWKSVVPFKSKTKPLRMEYTEGVLRLHLTEANKHRNRLTGGIYVDLPDLNKDDWAYIIVKARTEDDIGSMGVCYNLRDKPGPTIREQLNFMFGGEYVDIINDGSVKSYVMRADWSWGEWEGPWQQLILSLGSRKPAKIDLMSVTLVHKDLHYSHAPAGVRAEMRNEAYRRTLYMHAPGKLQYPVKIPRQGRLDFGLGVLRKDSPITFRVTVTPEGEEKVTLFEEAYSDKEKWAQRSVDLSSHSGQTVSLSLEADAEQAGEVALWAAPTITGARLSKRPNVIFYIIDGASVEYMSVYGYNRRTTPNLERIAEEGIVFENAWSNSTWTKVSNPSFMTSLHHSVLGGYKNDTDPIPDQAVTLSQHLHNAGYQTAQFSANPYTGTMSALEKGVDFLREAYVDPHSKSSEILHKDFWNWRESWPGEPYMAHFQSYDVHQPRRPVPPFTGLYITSTQKNQYYEWQEILSEQTGRGPERFEKTGISRQSYFNAQRGLYDEGMAHNDYQIGNLVNALKESGEWENTLLIIASDHGSTHIGGMFDPWPPRPGPNFTSFATHIPMIVIWPGHIAPGQRLRQPVSMIDILPTILDLVGLAEPEVMQGQSFAPLLLGQDGWERNPIIFDEFYVDWDEGVFEGSLGVIDGRWGAALEIDQRSEEKKKKTPEDRRWPSPLLLYDLWNDPFCLNSLHEEKPGLVKKYTLFLQEKWKEHRELAKRFTRSGEVPVTPEQLKTLRSLGYIE